MRRIHAEPTQYMTSDLISWQRDGSLQLHPRFQRRSVWKPGAKSYFIDTLSRGLPVPLILLRETIDLKTQVTTRQVVDGQQRLRTVFAFVDPKLLQDFKPDADAFTVSRSHNRDLAGKSFGDLAPDDRQAIQGYKFSVQVLPPDVDDREVLTIFARLNSTGTKLKPQELLNADFYGLFKTLMYDLALEYLDQWIDWKVFSPHEVARMDEVELVGDLTINMLQGLSGRSTSVIRRVYAENDERFPSSAEVTRRFRHVMSQIETLYGKKIATTAFRQAMHFFILFMYIYDKAYGLNSSIAPRQPKRVSPKIVGGLDVASARFKSGELPAPVLNAVRGAATDIGRRRSRFAFVSKLCDAAAR